MSPNQRTYWLRGSSRSGSTSYSLLNLPTPVPTLMPSVAVRVRLAADDVESLTSFPSGPCTPTPPAVRDTSMREPPAFKRSTVQRTANSRSSPHPTPLLDCPVCRKCHSQLESPHKACRPKRSPMQALKRRNLHTTAARIQSKGQRKTVACSP